MAGAILLADVNFEGIGYAVGDTGYIVESDHSALYIIDTVGAGGTVLTFTITFGGDGYVVSSEIGTHVGGAQPGGGSGFIVDILEVSVAGGPLNKFY